MATNILIIEDSTSVAELYRTQLTYDGYTVRVAPDGIVGLKEVKKKLPDLILLDIILPEKSGLTVLTELKNDPSSKDVPVIAISAFGSEENRNQALKLGAAAFVEKEKFDPKDISRLIKKTLK